MKKFLIFMLIVVMLLLAICFYSCGPKPFYFEYEEMKEKALSVEYICYSNDYAKIASTTSDEKPVFDTMKIMSAMKLTGTELDAFLKDLSEIVLYLDEDYETALEPIKECIRINLENGNFIILNLTCVDDVYYKMAAEFDSNGNFISHIANFTISTRYAEIVQKHFK